MGYASRSGRARVSSKNPQAFGICDRCGFLYNHVNLQWQFDWAGASLINKRILVCNPCNDLPQNQLRAIVLPADPVPIMNPRTQNYAAAETDNIITSGTTTTDPTTGLPITVPVYVVTQDGQTTSNQAIGIPGDIDPNAIPPQFQSTAYGVVLPVVSMVVSSDPTIVTVTCSAPHGLSTNSQVAVEGTGSTNTDGFFSVTVGTSQTTFTYTIQFPLSVGTSILGSTTLVKTAIVGIPYDFAQIPQTRP